MNQSKFYLVPEIPEIRRVNSTDRRYCSNVLEHWIPTWSRQGGPSEGFFAQGSVPWLSNPEGRMVKCPVLWGLCQPFPGWACLFENGIFSVVLDVFGLCVTHPCPKRRDKLPWQTGILPGMASRRLRGIRDLFVGRFGRHDLQLRF